MDKSDIANRMKDYENRNRFYLQRRMPVIIRVDMRAGHSFTRGFQRPFDEVFMKTMQETAKYLCKNVMNCKLAYVQSDEISLLLIDYVKLNTQSFFDYRVDKLCSIVSSMATMAFNKFFTTNYLQVSFHQTDSKGEISHPAVPRHLSDKYTIASRKGAMFDARCFNLPREEVTNYFYWRQLDASRNSVQMVGQANFAHKKLQNKTCDVIKDMLIREKGIDWNDLPTYQKRGSCVIKKEFLIDKDGNESENDFITDVNEPVENIVTRRKWIIDKEVPIFHDKGREYIEKLVWTDIL